MCGIAGYLRLRDAPLRREFLKPMCDRLVHRGPDGYGEFFDGDIALGHRRLSIVDLEGGAQPLSNEDGTVQVVFNGEIYNHCELRDFLETKGHLFKTRCDSEVIVHLYEEVQERTPEFLNGMFAFAIWDQRAKQLLLARDRFGEKPLYYSNCLEDLSFCFASELKALTMLPGFSRSVRPEAVAEYLSNSYIADPATIYKQVNRLSAGETLTANWSGIQTRRYWSPSFATTCYDSFDKSSQRLSQLVSEAVQSRRMSDVPLGAFLSGGLDSSTVVACMAEAGSEPVRTFSIGFSSPEFDERYYARLVADRFKTIHREATVGVNATDLLNVFFNQYDEPFGDASAIPTLGLSRLAREDVKVALSGDGADELFGGYNRYLSSIRRGLNSLLPIHLRRFDGAFLWMHQNLSAISSNRTVNSLLTKTVVEHHYRSTSMIGEEGLMQLLSPDVVAGLADYTPKRQLQQRFAPYSALPILRQLQLVDMETYLPADILVKMDRATMAFSLESRAPWLDHRLAEFAGTLPPHFTMRQGIGKSIVRRSFNSTLPPATLTRSKMGFSIPLAEWLRTGLKDQFESFVFAADITRYVNLSEVDRLWKEHQSGRHDDYSWILWNIFVLSRWHERFQR